VDFKEKLKGFTWLHTSGITPALSANCRELVMYALKAAKELGLTVSFDCNFRSALWGWQEARDCITEFLPYVDVIFGIEPINLRDENGNVVNFAVASSVIKHTMHGDFNITDDEESIVKLMNQEYEIRR